MKRSVKVVSLIVFAVAAIYGAASGYLASKRPVRGGALSLTNLTAPVTVSYDEFGVPHIQADNEADLYRAFGYVMAQDRLFQMEMLRRLARGELAEVLGPELVDTDRLFRTLRIREWADQQAAKIDTDTPATRALVAYLDGVNQYQNSRPVPLEFDLLGIAKRPFTVADTLSVTGYLAYSFAAAFKTEPVMTYLRDELGADYLKPFDLDWHANGVLASQGRKPSATVLTSESWNEMAKLALLSTDAVTSAGLPQLQGSNAWAVSGARTTSGKPILAGDPHIGFSLPAVWYEAHLSAPGFELYGHHASLIPTALLGLNQQFGWSLTMFENDDVDLVKETINPAKPNQVWSGDKNTGKWVELESVTDHIAVKGAAPVEITLRRSPHGPIVNDALSKSGDGAKQPIAMWWALYAADGPLLDAMYAMNRADTMAKARAAAAQIHAPGLNVIWANAAGDIGWWAAAKLPKRPPGVNPSFILDAAKGEADKPGWVDFRDNPQEENPPRGYIVSANHQPVAANGLHIPGYYILPDRGQRLDGQLAVAATRWDIGNTQQLQLDVANDYGPRILAVVLPILRERVQSADEKTMLELLAKWDGHHELNLTAPTLFNQLLYEIPRAAMADELGEKQGKRMFDAMLQMQSIDQAIPRLLADANSPWWDNKATPAKENRADTLLVAWNETLKHLRGAFGKDSTQWTWSRAHTLTHGHPLGQVQPLDRIFNAGPFPAPGGHETPNNLSNPIAALPVAVTFGPSTRRAIDFGAPEKSRGINPVGQSGVWSDPHYDDQAAMHIQGLSRQHYLSAADVAAHTRSTLQFKPSQH